MILMRILIYGTGVIGSLYAALFAEAGYDTYALFAEAGYDTYCPGKPAV